MKNHALQLIFHAIAILALATSTIPAAYAESQTTGCSYRDADQNNGWGFDHSTGQSCEPINANSSRHMVLNLKGFATGVEKSYDTTGDGADDTTAMCFDAPIIDPATGEQIGTGSDCLDVTSNDGGNIRLTGTGFFNLEGGQLVVQGQTTVRPVLQPTARDGVNFTHITGANADGGLLYGTGIYAHTSGKVRLSGQVDMSRVESESIIYFDCLFVIDFD